MVTKSPEPKSCSTVNAIRKLVLLVLIVTLQYAAAVEA
jgi:hypothetical protein